MPILFIYNQPSYLHTIVSRCFYVQPELLEELGDKGKGKRKADAAASPALGKSSKVR
jgi:hypothetical protein